MPLLSVVRNLLSRIRIRGPKQSKVVIFDNCGYNMLKKIILNDIDHSVLHLAAEVIYITPLIMLIMLKNIKYIMNNGKNKPISISGRIYLAYLLSCLEYMNPKVVITFMDNSIVFHYLSSAYDKADFFAIQNGVRARYDLDIKYVYTVQNLFCFGDYEIDIYKKYKHQIERFFPVGSLLGSYYKKEISNNDGYIEFDVCLISQWRDSIMLEGDYPEIKKSFVVISKYLSEYIAEKGLRLCVATPSDEEAQFNFYKDIYGGKATIIRYDRENFSTYAAMDSSDIIVAFDSTAAREAFGWGKKVLFCNYSGDDNYDSPKQGIWSLNDNNYDRFNKRLDYLRMLNKDEYREKTKEYAQYLMKYNDISPAHIYIRNIIMKSINSL